MSISPIILGQSIATVIYTEEDVEMVVCEFLMCSLLNCSQISQAPGASIVEYPRVMGELCAQISYS